MKLSRLLPLACAIVATSTCAQVQTNSAMAGLFSKPVESDLLKDLRGGSAAANSDVVLTSMTGTTTGNSVVTDQLTTGSNTISGGAFANMTGMPLVIQNSGANVLIQNSTVLNLRMN